VDWVHLAQDRVRRNWEGNIRIALREVWWVGVDWIHLAQDRGTGISGSIILELTLGK
jgi:hypothetical protein